MEPSRSLRSVISPWTLLGALVVALGLAGCFYLGLLFTKPGRTSVALGTAVINVIPAPSSTVPAPTIAPTPTITPTVDAPLPPEPGNIAIDSLVQINGTGGDPLRFRKDPGLSGQVVFLAIEAEVFKVTDGPVEADGYSWWYLASPYDPDKKGWAVANYLQVNQNP